MVRHWQRFARPVVGWSPILPYPTNSFLRWLAALGYLAFLAAAGELNRGPWPLLGAGILVGALAVQEVVFFWYRKNPDALHLAWSCILFFDVALVLLATALTTDRHTPVPVILVATIFTASEMFGVHYVITLTALAVAGVSAERAVLDAIEGESTLAGPLVWTLLIGANGLFAASHGVRSERLRATLIEADQHAREQAEGLRLALDAARSSESRFATFADHAPALMLMFDSQGTLTFRSSFAGMAPPGDTPGDDEWVPGLQLGPGREHAESVIRDAIAGATRLLDLNTVSANGHRLHLRGVAFPIEGGAGAILRDVTGELELSAQVNRAQQMETVGTLAGGVAHDFNNLLTAISGNLYMARQELAADHPTQEFIDEAEEAAERGARLVRRLLDFSRPTLGAVQEVNLAGLVRSTVELARPALTSRIAVHVAACEQATVLADEGSLQQVILNLLINARDAMPGGGAVDIACSAVVAPDHVVEGPGGEMWELSVHDTGTGMAEETVAHIFDPFFTTKEVGAGSGLGLPTSLGIVRAHGGGILVESAEGQGSTFRILLPRAGRSPAAGVPA